MNIREVLRAAALITCGFFIGCLFNQSLDYCGKKQEECRRQGVRKLAVNGNVNGNV